MSDHTPITPGEQGRSLGRIEGALSALTKSVHAMHVEMREDIADIRKELIQLDRNKVNKATVGKIFGAAIAVVAAGAAVAEFAFTAIGAK